MLRIPPVPNGREKPKATPFVTTRTPRAVPLSILREGSNTIGEIASAIAEAPSRYLIDDVAVLEMIGYTAMAVERKAQAAIPPDPFGGKAPLGTASDSK